MPRIEVIKNFATADECAELNSWTQAGVENKWLDDGISRGLDGYKKRLTSRMYGDRSAIPDVAKRIQNRICQHFGLKDFDVASNSGGDNGVVVSCTFKGGDVYPHIDPKYHDTLSTLRCNLLTSAADNGCDLYIDNEKTEFSEGDLVCYLVSEWAHNVTENLADKPRILWMFGWYVQKEDWEHEIISHGGKQ
jgi:hypothetical protein